MDWLTGLSGVASVFDDYVQTPEEQEEADLARQALASQATSAQYAAATAGTQAAATVQAVRYGAIAAVALGGALVLFALARR